MSEYNKLNLNDPFWFNDYKILFYKENISEFLPNYNMTLIEKLNAIFRMSVYLSILLYLLSGNYLYLYIMITVGLFSCCTSNPVKKTIDKLLPLP